MLLFYHFQNSTVTEVYPVTCTITVFVTTYVYTYKDFRAQVVMAIFNDFLHSTRLINPFCLMFYSLHVF